MATSLDTIDVGRVAMIELTEIFDDIGLIQYLQSFIDQGFDTWEVVLDITEPDLYVFSHALDGC